MSTATSTKDYNEMITDALNGMAKAITEVMSANVTVSKPSIVKEPFRQTEIGVLIGVNGDLSGQILLEGESQTFSSVGKALYGMELEGDMLESFTGELGNMISGNMVTNTSEKGVSLDISPPTVIVGNSKYTAFEKSICLPVHLAEHGKINTYMMLKGAEFNG
ncbi:chemotaxis protein CheX [Bacillus shivajii]|uniref:chemotaxis protein CheX n=1 Tax=Bacillus shivajii TaxID=1983719 RepID=UPI001CF93932|nr:chemotaxis protein CheX [Bacillus shivajii]UCZ53538.1 chemotaxis protein CheX [Bacillus shivajii]